MPIFISISLKFGRLLLDISNFSQILLKTDLMFVFSQFLASMFEAAIDVFDAATDAKLDNIIGYQAEKSFQF